MSPPPSPAFTRLVALAGGTQRALAQRLGVTEGAVSHYRRHGIPPLQARRCEAIFYGEITREEILPELFGPLTDDEVRAARAQGEAA